MKRVYLFEHWRDLPQLLLQRFDPSVLRRNLLLKAIRPLHDRGDLTILLRDL